MNPRAHWMLLGVLLVSYLALFAVYYPSTHGIEDEAGFINQGHMWSRGSLSAEGSGLGDVYDTVLINGRHVGWRNPGRSLLLVPFILAGGLRSVFLSGAIIQVALCVVSGLVLVRLGKSPLFASLVLFHPTLAIYSRTIMGDAPAALCILFALYAVVASKRPGLWAGVALGVGAAMRLHSLVALPFIASALLLALPKETRWRESVACCAAGFMAVVCMIAYNIAMFDSLVAPFSPLFSWTFALSNAGFYGSALTCIWPLMILAPFCVRSSVRPYVIALACPLLALLCVYYWYDKGASVAETLVLGQRLLQPVLPVWIVAYAVTIDDWILWRVRRIIGPRVTTAVVALVIIAQIGSVGVAFRAHQLHLQRFIALRSELASIIPEGSLVIGNNSIRKVFGVPYDGVPAYRWETLEYFGAALDHSKRIAAETREWYVVALPKSDAAELGLVVSGYIDNYGMEPVPTTSPGLMLYRSGPVGTPAS